MTTEYKLDDLTCKILYDSLNETKINQISPDNTLLDEVLGLQATHVTNLTDQQLSQFLFVLSQYQIYIQLQYNLRKIKFLDAKRKYELELGKSVIQQVGKTITEKEMLAKQNNPLVVELADNMNRKEADYLLFNNIPEITIELANALKKELSIRQQRNIKGKYEY